MICASLESGASRNLNESANDSANDTHESGASRNLNESGGSRNLHDANEPMICTNLEPPENKFGLECTASSAILC